MTDIRFAMLAVAGAALAVPVSAQQAPRALPAPNSVFGETFSSVGVGTIRELPDGRVIVADARDKIVSVIDFRTGDATPVGREGSGPGEFGLPMRLFAAPGDSTYLYDPLNQRYLLIGPDMKPASLFRVELAPTQGPGGMTMAGGISMARQVDGRGRLYMETPGIRVGLSGPEASDSSAIVRYDRATQRLDTLGMVKIQEANTQVSGGQGNVRVMMGRANPLTPRDEWAVFPDGRLAIVRSEPYRVDWVMPDGTKRTSAPIRYTPIRMTAADRREEEALRERARANAMMVMVNQGPGGTQRSAQMGPGPNAPPLPPLTDWPEAKPPFRAGMPSVLARPNGELWVRRLEPAGAIGTLYDIINPQGAVSYQVRIPHGWTLVGFGRGTVYTTRQDEDDLVYLQRHTVPETPLRG